VRELGLGLVLTVVVTGLMVLAWGDEALIPGIAFGLLATAIQMAALGALVPLKDSSSNKFASRYLLGVMLRLIGVVAVFVAIGVKRDLFPPLPTAFGYLGVLVPLLFTEVRLFR
jgi:hypothetical protein